MYAAKIIVSEMQSASGFQVRQFLRESVRQPREPSHLHPDREVLPLNERRTHVRGIRHAANRSGYNLQDWAWGVPLIPMLAVIPIQLL